MLDSLTVTIVAEDSVGYETPYLGQHGVSFYLEARHGSTIRRVLVDVAQHPGPLLDNMEILGIDPQAIDSIVLTHCHYDHTQGLAEVLRRIGKQDLPVIAHPDLFRLNFTVEPSLRHIGVMNSDTPTRIAEAGGTLYSVREPLQILPGLATSGEVPRTTDYENKETSLRTIRDGKIVVDEMRDELSVYANVATVGTVIVTGCSHAGIVNIVRHAKQIVTGSVRDGGVRGDGIRGDGIRGDGGKGNTTPEDDRDPTIAGVIGGLHLIEADAERVRRTVADLETEKIGHIYAGHCTGFPAQVALHNRFGQAFTPLRTGQVFSFPG